MILPGQDVGALRVLGGKGFTYLTYLETCFVILECCGDDEETDM